MKPPFDKRITIVPDLADMLAARQGGRGIYLVGIMPGRGLPARRVRVKARSWEHALELASALVVRTRNQAWDDLAPEERADVLCGCGRDDNRIERAFGLGYVMSAKYVCSIEEGRESGMVFEVLL